MSFWLAAFETDTLKAVLINIAVFRYVTDVSWNLAASIFRLVTEDELLLKTEGEMSPNTLLLMCTFTRCHVQSHWNIFLSVLFCVGRDFVIGESLPPGIPTKYIKRICRWFQDFLWIEVWRSPTPSLWAHYINRVVTYWFSEHVLCHSFGQEIPQLLCSWWFMSLVTRLILKSFSNIAMR